MTTETANPSQTDASTAFLRAARAGQLDKILALLNQDIDINVSNANGLNAMHLASKDGHAEVVGVLLQRGAHIDAATKKGNTALHIAALAGQEAVVRLLVQSGAQVNIQSQNGFTPLYMAAQENHDGVVKFLLANGANQSLATEDGFTPLAVAMQQGHEKVVAVLLEADTGRVRLPALHIAAKKDDCKAASLLLENDHNPDVTSKSGFTPLHIAAHYGNEAVAKLLLTKGADVNCAAKHNICPLHVAAKWGKANMVALLAENSGQVDAKTRDGLTPLHCAARSGHEHVVDMLLERGAPISGKSKNGLAPLHMAAQGDHSDAARILLYHRAPVDDLTVDYLTALHVAAHCGHVKVAKLLLDRNADANARALNGFTPLHIACKKNRIKVVELLLKYGASISATTESGLTPLHVAAFMGCMNIVIYLLQHEASPDVPTVRGETPLHLAARANQTDIIRILLRNGAAVDARAREMQTALHIASRLGNVDIVLLLVQHGAQLDALTADNYNALHIAAKQHNHEVAAVLLEHGAPPNAVTKKGFTPLHLAAKYGNLKVATLLMQQRGAELDPRGKNGVTPLHVAAQYKHHAVATALLEKGADPKAAAKNGHTPLHIAARKNQMETAAALMEKGAVVDAESRAGCTPLHLAAHQGHAEMCSLLMEQGAEAGRRARSGLAALHLAAQEDHVPVAKMLVNNGAKVDVCTKGGYTPLHVASHFGQTNMVKFLLESGADVQATTCHGYTALHHAAQQGHINIVNLLLEHKADANATTNNGQTPLDIAQRLGYVTVMDTLKGVSEPSPVPAQAKDDKYRPVAPETMYETFMSDSEEEGGEDTMLTDQPYRYLTVDDMKSLGDDSLPIDVTRDERAESVMGMKNVMEVSQGSAANGPPYVIDEISTVKTVNHLYNAEVMKEGYCYNVDSAQPKRKLQWKNFLVSFLVDARGGAMRGCRGGGVRVIVPPLSAQQPTRITCRYVRAQRVSHMPPLMEGEALASRVLELGPVSAKFIGPIILEVPHYASLRGKEREIVILRSDNGTTWREHALEAADCAVQDILADTLEIEDPPEEPGAPPSRMTRILTHDFPQYFAVISRIRQEVHAIGPEGGMVSSSVVPQVQAVFPQGALTKKIKVGLQAQTIEADLTAKLLGRGVAVSPVVTVEPRRRKFHKAITLSMPAPRPHSQGMINQYTTSAPTLRLLCSISGVFRKRSLEGGTNRAHWEDVTDSTPLTFVNDCVSFTTTVSARYWLMDCRNVSEATKMATELYREAIHVPFMAKFVVYAKRTEHLEAQLRVFCVTDDKEEKTLERMERFSQVAKSRDVEVHEGKPVYLEFGGNFTPVAKSGEQPKLEFRAFKESRLRLGAMVRGSHADAVARCQFMREPKRPKGEPTQPPICVLNILLPEEVIPMDLTLPAYQHKQIVTDEAIITENNISIHHDDLDTKGPTRLSDARITSICNLLGMDWVPLAYELGVSSASVASVREKGNNGAQQAALMLKLWREQGGVKAHDNALELALCRIGREDVLLPQSTADAERRIQRNIYQERQSSEEIVGYKSPDSELFEKDRTGSPILEQEDVNKVLDKDDIQQLETDLLRHQQQKGNKEFAMDDSVGERDEAKYSPEEKSYIGETEEGSDIEPSLTPSEESEEEEGVKKSVAERKIQITRKLSSSKVPSSKQKRELKEEIIEIKKQINPEIKKFHVQQTSVVQQVSTESVTKEPVGKLSKKSSEDEEIKKPASPPLVEQVESPKEKVLPKAGPRHMQKHVRNESMIRFSSGDFSDIQVTQKKPGERITETKVIEETIIKGATPTAKTEMKKETITTIDGGTKTITTREETISFEGRDIAEAPLRQKISSFESKMHSDKIGKTEKVETSKFKLTEEALKKHTEGHGTSSEYTEDFIKDQIRSQTQHEEMIYKGPKDLSGDPGSPDLVADFAAELMKAEETFMASADHTADKYTDNYFKGPQQTLPKSFPRAMRTDSTIVQFSSEEDNEYLKKSTDSETEPESQVVTVKQKVGMLEEQISTEKLVNLPISKSKEKISSEAVKSPKLTISIEQELIEEPEDDFSSKDAKVLEYDAVKVIKETDVDRLRVDSLEDSLLISSDEDAQIQPTDDESESHIREQLSFETADITTKMTKTQSSDLKTETTSASDTSQPTSIPQTMHDSPRHISQESPLPGWQSTIDKTDSLADSVQSTERDSYVSQSESKVYSKESRPGRSDSLDEASQFSDMEETQIGAAFTAIGAAASQIESAAASAKPALVRADTARFLEQESMFSSGELGDRFKRKPRTPTQEISAKARQFIETVPEDDSSVQDCFFSKRIYSDSLEESEQYGTDNDSRRPSEADSLKSDKSDPSNKDSDFKMAKISSEIEEAIDENIDSSLIDDERLDSDKDFNESDVKFELVKVKTDSKDEDSEGSDRIFDSKKEPSDVAEQALFKKITKRHSRNESVSLTKFSSLELKDDGMAKMTIEPPEIPLRATEFQMFVTEATDDYPDERLSSFEREELSDKISSESSREIEMSDKKSIEGDISNKISSEDAVTDKVSSDSGAQIEDSDLKASSDTLHRAGIKSPDLIMDDDKEDFKTKASTSEKIENKLTGRKESTSDTVSGFSTKLDDSLRGIKRMSLSSTGEVGSMELMARGGKRASDAPSLTDSRDYTFEESEDSIPQGRNDKLDLESRAKAILEPIYDKALRAVRGDSLDDVEPFCLDPDSESPRLPGIEETQTMSDKPDEDETTVKASALALALEDIAATTAAVTSGVIPEIKQTHLSLVKTISEDEGKDYSVHSSPDEVEEKICTDSESEYDQAKVLEIIEPTSEGDAGFIPSFDTTKLKQDSLDDADDFFPEKEMGFDGDNIYTTSSKQTTTKQFKPGYESSTVTTTVSTVEKSASGTKTVHETSETKIVESTLHTTESLVSKLGDLGSKFETTESNREAAQEHFDSIRNQISVDEDEEDSDNQHHIPSTLSEIGATVAASIGINLKSGDLIKSSTFVRKESKDSSSALDVEPKDSAETSLKSIGSKSSLAKREHSFTELLSDASSTLAASIGIDVKSDERDDVLSEEGHSVSKPANLKQTIEKQDSIITELISDASATLAATVGVDYRPETPDSDRALHEHPRLKSVGSKDSHDHEVSELIADASSTLAATVGIDCKPEEILLHSADKLTSSESKESLVKSDLHVSELISDASSALAASVGIDFKPHEIIDTHTDTVHTVTNITKTTTHSVQKVTESTELSTTTTKDSTAESLPIEVPLKFGEEHFLKQESTELDKFELDDIASLAAAKSVKEAISLTEKKVEEETTNIKKSLDDERSPELSMDDVEDADKLPVGMKDVDRLVRRCSDLLEGISQPDGSIIRIDTSHVTHGLSLKFSKTPPPSPVDLIHREQAGVASIADLTGQQPKGPDAFPDQTPSKLSPKDIRVLKDHLQLETEPMPTDLVTEVKTKVLSRSASPKSPTRHHADNISFVNVDALTIHPEPDDGSTSSGVDDSQLFKGGKKTSIETKVETTTDTQAKIKDFQESQITFKEETRKKFEDMKRDFEDNAIAKFEQMKKEFVGKDISKKTFEDFGASQDGTTLISKRESVTHQISGKEFYSETKEISSTDDDIKAKVETKRQISGEEYELKQKESIEKSGDITHSERSSVERDEKGSAEREDSEIQEAKKIGDDVAILVTTQREFAEQSLYSGRQSKSEEKMTAIKDDVSKKSEISYSERDLSHEQWGKEYFTERTELEPTEELEAEFSQGNDVEMASAVKIVEMDEKITSEELTHEGVVISASKGYSKEESTVESKEHDDMSSDNSHDTSFKSEVAGKRGSFDEKSEMSPKSRSKSLKKEEVYEVDFIKEIRVSTSQRDKSLSQGGSLDTQSESDLTGESDFVMQAHQDLPDDLKSDDISNLKGKTDKTLEKKLSPVHKPEENIIREHVWEVSVQQQEPLDEMTSEIHLQSRSIRDESRSWDADFASHSESKSSISGSDIGLMTISSDRDVKIRLNGLSLTSSEDIHDAEAPSEEFESFKDSMIKSGESVETEYMIQSIDSQDAETLQKSMDSVSADTMQHSEKEDYSLEAESSVPDLHHRKGDHKIVKEKSLEDICSSGYDTDLSSAEFLASKLELERADVPEPVRPQPLAELSDLEKTIDEVKQSLEAAHGQIISEKSDSSIKYKQSPSEFEFKLISPDRPEVIQEEPPEVVKSEQIKLDSKPTVTGYIQKQAYASSAESEEQHQVKKDYVEIGEELTTINKSIEITMTDKDIQISVKDSDTSSSKHDDTTTVTSDDEKDTAHEKERPCNTQQEFSDISTGLESGPMSLLDTETELTSDKEESPKGSPEALVKLRPIHKHVKSAHVTGGDRRSGSDVEGWSSSGESHYQSFEHTDSPQSRPLSSDVENLLTGHSTADFHSALTTQDTSLRSHKTSKEYYTAVSSISSRDSMRSLDSESSGNLASVDISDASETLVPSATELKEEMMESGNFNEPFETDNKLKDIPIKEMEESAEDLEVRQIQMIANLDVVSHPIGSSDHSEEGSLDDEVNAINENSEIISKMKRSHEMSFQPKELLPDKFPSESLSESVDMDLESIMPESDSQVFTMSKIETGPREIKHVKESTEVTSTKSTHSRSKESPKSFEVSEKIVEYHTSSVVYKTPEKKRKPAEIEETIIERKVTTVKTESKPSITTTLVEQQSRDVDFDSMMGEIIPKGSQEYEEIVSCQVLISKPGPSVSSTSSYEKKIVGPYPLDSQQSSSSSLKIQEDHLSTPQTPISNPSQSSESTDNGREYVLDDMYEISEDPELFHSERAMTDSKSEISVTAEERTLYETHKEPESPSSDEFEMVDKPSEIDDFVVIEEVAKEASEFDAEGKSLSIGKIAMVKKHDEEIEEYLSQTAKKTSETEYSTSGSLSEEEILQYELEQKRLKAAETAEIEAGKKWIQMQFEGDLAAARYDYERGPLEDIKEEEMTDFDASRFGSLTSQKESVGSYGSLKNSYGSLSESEMNLRKRYMMRYGEQDDISVSSLQEFEHLEQALSMENYQHSSSSQDSLNGSLSRRYHLSKGPQGDDVSVSSLKEFEGLESACLEALKMEINAKQKEALLLSHDGRLSSAGFLDMERRSYSQGSSESSPPQKSSSSPGQKSGSPSQKSSSPSLKSGSPGQKFGSPSQKSISETVALRKMIDQQMAEGVGDVKVTTSTTTDGGTTITYVTAQKKVFDKRGAFYVPDTSSTDCEEVVCSKKTAYKCQTDDDGALSICQEMQDEPPGSTELGSSFTEMDANMIGIITTTKVVQKRFIDGKMVSETVTTSTGKGMDIPGAAQEDQSGEFGSGSFHSIDVGSGKSDFSTSMTSQQSDTESLITMMEQQLDSELGSLETLTFSKKVVVASKPAELDLGSRSSDASDSGLRETSPLSNRSGSGVFSGITSKPFTDPASGSWSGLDEDMSSSGSFSRNERHELKQARLGRAKEEDLMLGSTDSLEQTSSNATRATYNYEVDTPMTGSLTSAGSNTMVSSLETLEPLTTVCDKGERTLRLSTEDCFTADHSGSEHIDEYEIHEPDSDLDKQGHSKPQVKERTIRFGSEGSSEDTSIGQSGSATFFIGDTPIIRGEKSGESSAATYEPTPPVPAQRKSLTGLAKPISFEAGRFQGSKEEEEDDEENV